MEYFALNPGFSLFGRHIAWYGLIMACAISIAVILCFVLARKRGLKSSDFVAPALWALPLAIIGARIMYVLFNPMGITYSFVDALKIWEGGMSIWGGIVGGALGIALYCLIFKKNFLAYGDVIAPGLILAQSIGRWGNFINQEVYGAPTTLPWAIHIDPQYRLPSFSNYEMFHPLFLYESIWSLGNMAFLLWFGRKYRSRLHPGDLLLIYAIIYPVGRFLLEFLRLDASYVGAINANQLLMAVIAILSAGLLFWRHNKERQVGFEAGLNSETDEEVEE